jgi:hypothetical protein
MGLCLPVRGIPEPHAIAVQGRQSGEPRPMCATKPANLTAALGRFTVATGGLSRGYLIATMWPSSIGIFGQPADCAAMALLNSITAPSADLRAGSAGATLLAPCMSDGSSEQSGAGSPSSLDSEDE